MLMCWRCQGRDFRLVWGNLWQCVRCGVLTHVTRDVEPQEGEG